MTKISSITFEYVLKILQNNCSISLEEMLSQAELTKQTLSTLEYIPSDKLSTIFKYCVQKSGDNALALKIGCSSSYHSLGILGYLMSNAKTLKEVIEKFDYYQRLISGFLKFKLLQTDEYYKLVIYINENPMIPVPRFHSEVHLSAIITILSQILNQDIKPNKTYFSFEENSNLDAYKNIFGENLFFSKDENAIYFDMDTLKTTVINSNLAMLKYFEAQADQILASREDSSYYNKIKKEILKTIGEYDITIEFIAKRLSMSPRTLQYVLKDENKKFRNALLEVKMQLANHLIKSSKMNLSSISFYLGYSEPSSFFRAYKKYHKKRPTQIKILQN